MKLRVGVDVPHCLHKIYFLYLYDVQKCARRFFFVYFGVMQLLVYCIHETIAKHTIAVANIRWLRFKKLHGNVGNPQRPDLFTFKSKSSNTFIVINRMNKHHESSLRCWVQPNMYKAWAWLSKYFNNRNSRNSLK